MTDSPAISTQRPERSLRIPIFDALLSRCAARKRDLCDQRDQSERDDAGCHACWDNLPQFLSPMASEYAFARVELARQASVTDPRDGVPKWGSPRSEAICGVTCVLIAER